MIFSTDDLMDTDIRSKWKDMLLNSSIIFLDIDPHEGTREYNFYLWLKENKYKGLLILDDIHYFKEMRDNVWHKIPSSEKCDATSVGHWSGTGFVTFNNQTIEIYDKAPQRVPKSTTDNSWTVVTAYFNLTKTNDASSAIKERDISYYMKHANMCMALDQNLVVYCDLESESYLRSLRPSHLEHKTRYIITEFMDINIVKNNYHRVVENRTKTYNNFDSRNTPSYYLYRENELERWYLFS